MESSRRTAVSTTTRLLGALPGALMRRLFSSRPRAQALASSYDTVDSPGLSSSRDPLNDSAPGAAVPVMTAAINLLAMTIAALPRGVIDVTGQVRSTHPITRLLNRNFPRWPAVALWDYLYRSALTYGIGYAYILRRAGQPYRLVPCSPVLSSYHWDYDRRRLRFNLQPVEYPRLSNVVDTDVLLVVGDGYGGLRGLSPLSAYGVTFGVLRQAYQHLHSTLSNGMHVSGVVESEAEVGAGLGWDLTRIADLRKRLVDLFAGTLKAGGVPVMPPGFKFSAVPYNAVDIQLVQLLELSIEDVCRIYRVPPRLVYHFRSGIRYSADAEAANSEFAQYSIKPRTQMLGALVASQLLSDQALNEDGLTVQFDTDSLYAGTVSQRIAAIDQGVARSGILTVNEGREYLRTGRLPRLDPVPDGDRVLDPKGAPVQPRGGGNPGSTAKDDLSDES